MLGFAALSETALSELLAPAGVNPAVAAAEAVRRSQVGSDLPHYGDDQPTPRRWRTPAEPEPVYGYAVGHVAPFDPGVKGLLERAEPEPAPVRQADFAVAGLFDPGVQGVACQKQVVAGGWAGGEAGIAGVAIKTGAAVGDAAGGLDFAKSGVGCLALSGYGDVTVSLNVAVLECGTKASLELVRALEAEEAWLLSWVMGEGVAADGR